MAYSIQYNIHEKLVLQAILSVLLATSLKIYTYAENAFPCQLSNKPFQNFRGRCYVTDTRTDADNVHIIIAMQSAIEIKQKHK
jgi:hypothetical protein